MNGKTIIRLGAAAIVVAALISAAVVLRSAPSTQSDPITGPWESLGGEMWLLPNLDQATVVVPDRPHARSEVNAHLEGAVPLERTRAYTLSTDERRVRRDAFAGAATQRIGVIGDSVAMGHGVDDLQAWPALLEERLRAGGHDVDVLNAACPAAGLHTMETWCRNVAPGLDLDLVVWARRGMDSGTGIYRQHVQRCQEAVGVPVVAVLHPTSTFDLRALREADREGIELKRLLDIPVLDLNPPFRAAAQGRGHTLRVGPELELVAPSGQVVASGPADGDNLPDAIYAAFEADEEVREALFFDGAHPDVEGQVLYAAEVAALLEPLL